jgi:hypothetical protein
MGQADGSKRDGAGWSRREVVVGTTVAVAALGVGAHRLLTRSASASAPELGGVAPGVRIDRWKIVAVHPVRFGAIPIVLATEDGRRYQIDVLARDDAGPQGVASTDRLSLYIANQGDGEMPTDEEQGLGAIALARALAEHERRAQALPELLTLRQRIARHEGEAFGVAVR